MVTIILPVVSLHFRQSYSSYSVPRPLLHRQGKSPPCSTVSITSDITFSTMSYPHLPQSFPQLQHLCPQRFPSNLFLYPKPSNPISFLYESALLLYITQIYAYLQSFYQGSRPASFLPGSFPDKKSRPGLLPQPAAIIFDCTLSP